MEQTAKMALMTGATRGRGLETYRQLARLGYQVILTSREETTARRRVESRPFSHSHSMGARSYTSGWTSPIRRA